MLLALCSCSDGALRRLVFATDMVKDDFAGFDESHTEIELDGAIVVGADMKP